MNVRDVLAHVLLVLALLPAASRSQTIETVAGGGPTGPMDARAANLRAVTDTAVDQAGNLYIAADTRVFRVTPAGVLTVAAGSGAYSGVVDGQVPVDFFSAGGIELDPAGNLYITDPAHNRVLKQDAATGVLQVIAGNGLDSWYQPTRDGVPATQTTLWNPSDVALDGAGNVFITDSSNNRIRRVDAVTGIISTVAGDGTAAGLGDGLNATNAQLFLPTSTVIDAAGNLYIADTWHNRVRKVTAATGRISTIAGNGLEGYTGDGGLAVNARLSVARLTLDPAGNLYIADTSANRVRKIDASTGIISTVAGSGVRGFAGDGGAALAARFDRLYGVTRDATGNLYLADSNNRRVRKVDAASGIVDTVAGSGDCCVSGDGGLAVRAATHYVTDATVDSQGNLYLTSVDSHRIRKVDRATGIITTIAGTGDGGYTGDGGPATGSGGSTTPRA